jgi:Plastocyanin
MKRKDYLKYLGRIIELADWELLIPGLGLTILGLVGVAISLSGIAKTFEEGMHAISAVTMLFGMILLAAGILKGGLPRSNEAKAATIFIVGILAALGGLLAGISNVTTLPLLIGVIFLILAPATIIAYAVHKGSRHVKAISIIFISGSVTGFIAFSVFSYIQQPVQAGLEEQSQEKTQQQEQQQQEPVEVQPAGPRFEITIPAGSSVQGNLAYDPLEARVSKGTLVVWKNIDNTIHTVTSGVDFNDPNYAKFFDSGLLNTNDTFTLDTSKLDAGEYDYFCILHVYMKGKLIVVEEMQG